MSVAGSLDVVARPGVVLMAGHAGNAVVQDDADGVGAVVGHFGQELMPVWKNVESPMQATTRFF